MITIDKDIHELFVQHPKISNQPLFKERILNLLSLTRHLDRFNMDIIGKKDQKFFLDKWAFCQGTAYRWQSMPPRRYPCRDQPRGDISDSDAASDTASVRSTSSSIRNTDTSYRQGYKRPNMEENVDRKDDSKRHPGPSTDQGVGGQPPITNSRGNRLTNRAVTNSISSSSSTGSKMTPAATDPNNVLISKDNVDPNPIKAIGVLDQYAYRSSVN